MIVSILLLSIGLFVVIKQITAEASEYNIYYAADDLNLENFEFYRITLSADSKFSVTSQKCRWQRKRMMPMALLKLRAIRYYYSRVGVGKVTEEYDFIDNEIRMNKVELTTDGTTFLVTTYFK